MRQQSQTLVVTTRGPSLTDVTRDVVRFVRASKIRQGLLTLFLRHTSASLLVQENADQDVLRDLSPYRHTAEGLDDMPAHIRAALTQTSLSIPIEESAMVLGTWQAIHLFEHRDVPHKREIVLHVIGE